MEWAMNENNVRILQNDGEITISFPKGGGVRLQYGAQKTEPSWCPILAHEPETEACHVSTKEDGLHIASKSYTVVAGKDGSLGISGDGWLLWHTPPQALSRDKDIVKLQFRAEKNEQIYGLGQDPMARLNHNGCERRMWNQWGGHERSGNCGIGFFTSSAGYGILLNTAAAARFCFNESKPQQLDPLGEAMVPSPFEPACPLPEGMAQIEVHGPLDIFVFFGSRPELLSMYYSLTGLPCLLPKWAYGFLQCKNRYMNREDLLNVARRFRESNIPCDGLIIDWLWFTEFGDLEWREDDWPGAASMLEQLSEDGFRVSSAQHPFISDKGKYYAFYKEKGYLNEVPPTKRVTYDHTNPEARKHWWEKTAKLYRQGIRGYWTDMGELEEHFEGTKSFAGGHLKTHNAYSLLWAKGLHEGQKADFGTRAFILMRSGSAGIQKYGAALWSGDISSTWQVLRDQVVIGQGMAMSGLPWWCTDIGGFLTGDEFTPELYIRWMEWGVFCSVFRTHGTRPGNEPWSFGDEAQRHIEALIRLRCKLLPYIYSLAMDCALNGTPVVRPLGWEYPNDAEAAACEGQFFFGPSLLAAPVTQKGARSQRVYLPEGTWRHWWTGERYGNGWHTLPAPLGQIPLFVREGSIIPIFASIGRNIEDCRDLALMVVPGTDDVFDYYDDAGDGFAYENGDYHHVRFLLQNGAVHAEIVRGHLPGYVVQPFVPQASEKDFAIDCSWRGYEAEFRLTFLKEGSYSGRLEPESGWQVTNCTAGGAKAGDIFEQAYYPVWEGKIEGKPGDIVRWNLTHTASDYRLDIQKAILRLTSEEGHEITTEVHWDGPYLSAPKLLGCLLPKGPEPLDVVYPPEEDPDAPFYEIDGVRYHWQQDDAFERNSFGYIDFRRLGAKRDGEAMFGVAYAREILYAKTEGKVQFFLRYDSPIALFLNGEKVFKGSQRNASEVQISLPLKAGRNTLLVKQAANIARPYSGGEFGYALQLNGLSEVYSIK